MSLLRSYRIAEGPTVLLKRTTKVSTARPVQRFLASRGFALTVTTLRPSSNTLSLGKTSYNRSKSHVDG